MKSSKATEEGTPSFHRLVPIEITEIILSKLPVKSLIRFQSVSKSWSSVISDRRFRRIHYDTTHNINTAPLRALYFNNSHDFIHLVKVENKNLGIECALKSPFGKSAKPGATCNGVVLMVKYSKEDFRTVFALWNPSIRKHSDWIRPNFDAITDWIRPNNFDVRFPNLNEYYALMEDHRMVSYGLYHDPATDDYKIAIVYDKYYDVYSCKSRSWSGAKAFPCPGRMLLNVNGSSSFYCENDEEILRFDARDGEVSKIPLPDMNIPPPYVDRWGGQSRFHWNITRLSGRLGLVSELNCAKLRVWVMEERDNSWTEVVNNDDGAMGQGWWPVLVTDDGDLVVIMADRKNKFSMFDCVEKRFKKLEGVRGSLCCMLRYSESLYFPDCSV